MKLCRPLLCLLPLLAACSGSGTTPDSGPACPALSGTEVTHSSDISAAESWAGDGTVHRVTFGITLRPGGTLTLAPCAVVKINAGLVITLNGTPAQPATLISAGTADQPVLITNAVSGNNWGSFVALNASSTMQLSYTTLENGGAVAPGFSLTMRAGGPGESAAIPVLKADHLVIKGSKLGTSLVMESGAAFTSDSTELTVIGGGGTAKNNVAAIQLTAIAAGTLPKLNVSGNARDQVQINAGYISRDLTLQNLGVPYYFYFDRVRVTDQARAVTPTLTVKPGVELRFDDYLEVGFDNPGVSTAPGKLLAIGTAAEPIVFTSSQVARDAGDWPGVFLFNAAGSRMENVRIEFAGGRNGISSSNCKPSNTTDNAALFIGGFMTAYVPSASDFVSVRIESSASHGINSMWQTGGAFTPDLTAGFTFGSINGCRQTRNRAPDCGPPPVPCLVP